MGQFGGFCVGHLGELVLQQDEGGFIGGDVLLHHHVVDAVEIAGHAHGQFVGVVLGIEGEVVALLGLEVAVAETDLGLAPVDGVVVVVEFVQSGGTEACRVGGTEVEGAGGVHQCGLGGEVSACGLVVGVAYAHRGCHVFQEALLVLSVEGEGVDALVDVAGGGEEVVFPPVAADDGGAVVHQAQDGLEVGFVGMLLLGQDEVAHLVTFGGYVVLLAVAEAVGREGGLQGVLLGELVDAAEVPAGSLVLHLVVGSTRDVGVGIGTVGDLVGVVEACVERQVVVGRIGELLPEEVGAVACEEGRDALLCLGG